MLKRFFLAAGLVLAAGSMAQAQTIVNIDNFNDTQSSISRTTAGSTSAFHTAIPTSTIGGNRRITLTYTSGNVNEANQVNFTGTQLSFNEDASVLGSFTLQYGVDTNGNPVDLSTSVVGTSGIRFDRVFLDLNSTVNISIVSNRTGAAVTATLTNFAVGGGGNPGQTIVIPYTAFTNGSSLNLSDIDQVTFTFNASQVSTDFVLDNLQFVSVPEPTSLALIGAGIGGVGFSLWNRRRRAIRVAGMKI